MRIRGRFIGGAPYFAVYLRSIYFQGSVWFLADTGASRTTLLDRDVKILGIAIESLEVSMVPIVGVGGSVRSFIAKEVEFTFFSDQGEVSYRQDLWVVQHDLDQLPPEEVSRILRLPSVLGRDFLNRFLFFYDYPKGVLYLEKKG